MAKNYKFDDKTSKLIDKLKEQTNSTSGSEVIRKALGLLKIAAKAHDKDYELVVKRENVGKADRTIVLW